MKKIIFSLLFMYIVNVSAQISQSSGIYFAKEYSKDISLFKAKKFLINDVLKIESSASKFEAIPLAASSSGELTTLLYRCEEQNLEGLILGFYGDYWNNSGVAYQGYGFKNLPKNKAYEFLNKIENEIQNHKKFLRDSNDNNNIAFDFEDLKVMIWTSMNNYYIRVFWNSFDATWESTSYERSKRRFEKKVSK